VVAAFTDDTGQSVSATSNATGPVKDVAPTLSVALSGNAVEGATLIATPTLGTDSDNSVADVTYQWQRNGNPISGATGSTYLVGEADEDAQITVVASFTDDTGQTVGTTTTPVLFYGINAAPPFNGPLTISEMTPGDLNTVSFFDASNNHVNQGNSLGDYVKFGYAEIGESTTLSTD
jgi:hypothetical protein